jgi:hypothetical protein
MIRTPVLYDMTPCIPVDSYQLFRLHRRSQFVHGLVSRTLLFAPVLLFFLPADEGSRTLRNIGGLGQFFSTL